MKILIIGSKGFIGSHCYGFFEKKFETWGCDIFTDYNEKNFILYDALNTAHYNLFQNNSFDLCLNCAGAASVPDSWKFPLRDFELNSRLVSTLLDSIRLYSPNCKFINISSAAVYGTPQLLPIQESAELKPLSPYGRHKMYAENICQEFALYFNLKTCSLRIFSAYGPGLRKQIFWDWYSKAKDSKHLVLPGTGRETRDYIYIEDILTSIDYIVAKAEYKGECYNVGSGEQSVIGEVATQFFHALNWKGKIEFNGQVRAGEPLYWQADISKVKSFGFKPQFPLSKGIDEYLKWVRNS